MRDAEHPFFRPLWRRIAVVCVCAAWAAWELWLAEPMWTTIAVGMAVYAAWTYLIAYKAPPEAGSSGAPPENKE